MDCKHGQHVSFCPDLLAWVPKNWVPNYFGEKRRNPNMETEPTPEERRKAEVEAFRAGKRYSTNLIPHADGCECPKCKPGKWT